MDALTCLQRAEELNALLRLTGFEVRCILIDNAANAAVDPEAGPGLVRQPQVRSLVGEVDPLHAAVGKQELVAEVATLVVDASQRRDVLPTESRHRGGQIVRVDQIFRRRAEVEERKDAGLDAELP